MYHPTTRLLTILELLQTHPMLGAAELAQRLEVDPRTIRRYITMLQDLGMPLETVRGPGGGYRLRPGFKLPPLLFTVEEATAIVLGLLGIASQQIDAGAVPVEGALAKVLRVLPLRGRETLSAVAASLNFSPPEQASRLDPTLLLDLSVATQRRQRVAMSYHADADRVTRRTVEPYGLAGWWGEWYLVGYCCLREGMRTFRLDRMRDVRVLDETFTRQADFDTHAYLSLHLGRASALYSIEIEFHASLAEVQRRIPSDYGTLASRPTGTLFATRHGNLGSVARFVIGLNLPFVVLDPPELRETIRRLAQQLLASI